MIEHIQHLRSIGKFDNVSTRQQLPLQRVALIYAENGRGKTTLSAVLRSLATGASTPILERQRLGSTDAPQAALKLSTEQVAHVFQDGVWDKPVPPIAVFDDTFVAENVCAGIEIETSQRRNLHELILGEQGVTLNSTVKVAIDEVEAQGRDIRAASGRLPEAVRFGLDIDEFCALTAIEDIEADIIEKERAVATAQSSEAVLARANFQPIGLPYIDQAAIEAVLETTVDSLDREASAMVSQHIGALGGDSERWLREGMSYSPSDEDDDGKCPYCAQALSGSELFSHYRAYFGEAYRTHTADLERTLSDIRSNHGGQSKASLERSIREFSENATFWSDFIDPPTFDIDIDELVSAWDAASQAVMAVLQEKVATPLDRITVNDALRDALEAYRGQREKLMTLNVRMERANVEIESAKEQARNANVAAAQSDLSRSRAIMSRFSDEHRQNVEDYQAAVAAKRVAENQRDDARRRLDDYRRNIFPMYRDAINEYLARFNAGFRLENFGSANSRGGSACNYEVVIDTVSVPLGAREGEPSFRNTLSAGDRNTLALAFFFASIEHSDQIEETIVVVDDPMTSLDEHRSIATVKEMTALSARVSQLIVLSHSKPFLFEVWNDADRNNRSAIQICRWANSSELAAWDVTDDCVTLHDRRHSQISRFVNEGQQAADAPTVAIAIRPQLESFLRVAFPDYFKPGGAIGPFVERCRRRSSTATPILSEADINELDALKDFGNLFHHDTNPVGYLTQHINDAQLLDFARRTLAFTTRPAN